MREELICKYCEIKNEVEHSKCKNCGYPLHGSEKEKAIFIGKQIAARDKKENAMNRLLTVRFVLWFIGFYNIIISVTYFLSRYLERSGLIVGLITGTIFIVMGFLIYKNPRFYILVCLLILLVDYWFQLRIDRASDYYFLFKILFIFYLVRALIITEKTKRQPS